MGPKWTEIGCALAAACLIVACTPGRSSRCVPGRTIECPCATGDRGVQTCSAEGVFSPCACLPVTLPDASKSLAVTEPEPVAKPTAPAPVSPALQLVPARQRLLGTWVLDAEAFGKSSTFEQMAPEKRATALRLMKSTQIEIVFDPTSIAMVVSVGGKRRSEKLGYRVVTEEANALLIESDDPHEGSKKTSRLAFDGDRLVFHRESGPFYLSRKR